MIMSKEEISSPPSSSFLQEDAFSAEEAFPAEIPTLKLILVDDEPHILSALSRMLRKENYEIITTENPDEVLQYVQQEKIAVVVSDQRMPSMSGADLLSEVRRLSPETIRIILTGYSDMEAAVKAINEGAVYQFLSKPWQEDHFKCTLRQAVEDYQLRQENKRLQQVTQQQNEQLKEFNDTLGKKVLERTRQIFDLNQELQKGFTASVQVLASLSELHSRYVGSHAKRVAAISKTLAKTMGMSEKEIFQIEMAATLHDIGKVALSSEVLNKPANALTRQEQEQHRRHVLQGETLVRMIPGLEEAAIYVRHHHERYDGSGYPDQLQGEHIPLGARIIAVADAFDKALNQRNDLENASPEKALKHLQSQSVSIFDATCKFDPDVINALRQYVESLSGLSPQTQEIEIRPQDLRAGMRLSRDLMTVQGTLLLPKDSIIQTEQREALVRILETTPLQEGLCIYRQQGALDSETENSA